MRIWISTIAMLLILVYSSSCKKVYDYIDKNPTATCDACKITTVRAWSNSLLATYDVGYDKKGNLTSCVARPNPTQVKFFIDQYFRYDKKNRLTDWIHSYSSSTEVISWFHFVYTSSPTIIIDSIFSGAGSTTDPAPPYGTAQSRSSVLTLDNYGRVIDFEGWRKFDYDVKGNLVSPKAVYDNKINPYRTNHSWQFTNPDFSANNPQNDATNTGSNAKIIAYNSYGLPTKYVRTNFNEWPVLFAIIAFDSLEITYDCDISKIKY